MVVLLGLGLWYSKRETEIIGEQQEEATKKKKSR
jgi:hypothetical protein